ncbi:MAG TPA: biotin/lipoyl-containing protein, partial [Microbacteriaceae bacterium]|nr:biotin/lipoyl-containing protein [Microbacteriaceae bacterium]
HSLRFPGGPGIRIDSGVTTGDVISGAFDSLLAKVIVTGATRADALERARRALDEFEITGLPTVLPFHRNVVRDPAFTSEPFSVYTSWIENEWAGELEPWSGELQEPRSPAARTTVVVEVGGKRVEVSLPAKLVGTTADTGATPPKRKVHGAVDTATGDAIKAPMQATIVKVAVEEGQRVVKGETVLVLEAMKMEQPLAAHKDGVIAGLDAPVGQTVASGHLLLTITD